MSDQKEPTRGQKIAEHVSRLVDGFLSGLEETAKDELDAVALERAAMTVACEVGLALMREVLVRADEEASEVIIHGARWGARQVTMGVYTTKFGTVRLLRSGYQKSGRGRVQFPLDLRLGMVEGRYTPAMASLMAHTVAHMPSENGEAYLAEVGVGMVSHSTLSRIPQDMSAVYERDRVEIEAVVRAESRVPEGTHTIQAGMDGVMVPMEGEHHKPRGRKAGKATPPRHERHYGKAAASPADDDDKSGVAYHEASVSTLAYYDAEGQCLGIVYGARMPEFKKATLAVSLEDELAAALEDCPRAQVALASDGAATHWEHLTEIQQRLPEGTRSIQLLDFCHGAHHLYDAAKLCEADEGSARALAGSWRSDLRHRKDGPAIILRALRYQRDVCQDENDRDELETTVEFFAGHKQAGRLDFKQAENDGYPLGTGPTEAAAKSVLNIRMKRAGARYSSHGGQTILTFRAAMLSCRLGLVMREITKRYSALVVAA